jgi:hypothetical protein
MRRSIIIVGVLLILLVGSALAQNNLITNDGIEGIRIGDSANKILPYFQKPYQIIDKKEQHAARTITVLKDNRRILEFSIDDKGGIFFIDIRGVYVTKDGVGCGSTIEDAIKAYGSPSLSPEDEGYLLYFERLKNISFLLNNKEIPKELRNIPDDVFEKKDQDRILKNKKIHIRAVKITKAE